MSDEWKVVSYVDMRFNAFAVASLQPSLVNPYLARYPLDGLYELREFVSVLVRVVDALKERTSNHDRPRTGR